MDSPTVHGGDVVGAFETNADSLVRFARARLRDGSTAEDVVQEAYLRLTAAWVAGQFPSEPKAWLFRVVHNLIVSGARRTAVAHRHLATVPGEEATTDSPEIGFLALERAREVRAAVSTTRIDARRALLLASRGYTSGEIARLLGRTDGATRTMLCRARKDVRRALLDQDAALTADRGVS